jgi:integrase
VTGFRCPLLRLQRAVLASSKTGRLYVDTLKGRRARTVPLPPLLVALVDERAGDKSAQDWLFSAPAGGPLSESNWKRSVRWDEAVRAIDRPRLRPHDLRHTAASMWLDAGADPKVVQRVLGHASAAMTMDLYGHLIDHNLWSTAKLVGGTSGWVGQ